MSFFAKTNFYFKKPKIIIVTGNGSSSTTGAIFQILSKKLKVRKILNQNLPFVSKDEILIFETKVDNLKLFNFLIKNSSQPILMITHFGEIPPDRDSFLGDKKEVEEILKFIKTMSANGQLILNFDDEAVREIKNSTNLKILTFGFQSGSDFRASDIKLNHGTNFKLNYQGNTVPIWLDYLFGKEQIYSALAAISIATIFDLNLVEISQVLKSYQGIPGKMRLTKGIKNSLILDDSESATLTSMQEALDILGKIEIQGRRIAVLGDILGLGEYAIESHEALGEKVMKSAGLLFTVGPRAKFIAEKALVKGMKKENVFSFNTPEEAGVVLQNEIKEEDLILVDGSKELKMEKVVKEVQFTPLESSYRKTGI
jgi:UDP-N-acetylmuramoyl-tripeptide--D-alanyl-D-alanine ligase